MRAKAPVKTLKKFDNGNSTPQEYHRRHAFPPGATCACCPNSPSVRAVVMAECKEAIRRGMVPQFTGNADVEAQLVATMINLKGPSGDVPHFRLSVTYACPRCRPTMEKALAKAPSFVVVDIQRGPDENNRVVFGAF
jgi:hypothetical protein